MLKILHYILEFAEKVDLKCSHHIHEKKEERKKENALTSEVTDMLSSLNIVIISVYMYIKSLSCIA